MGRSDCEILGERGNPGGDTRKGATAGFSKVIVTARLVEISFRNDHTIGDPNTKLIKPTPSPPGTYGDATGTFTKPEWDSTGKNDPVSISMNSNLAVDLVIDFTVLPPGKIALLTGLTGTSSMDCLKFSQTLTGTVGTERKTVTMVPSSNPTPGSVQVLSGSIQWSVTANGTPVSLGSSGPHTIYNTLAYPTGQMISPFTPTQSGPTQDITEERLRFVVTRASGQSTERSCLDSIYKQNKKHYDPGSSWTKTGYQLTFHHYLWQVFAGSMSGDCRTLATGFILVSRAVGVLGQLDLGFMYPWGSRDGNYPYSARSNPLQGKYNDQDTRQHTISGRLWDTKHGDETMYFVDSNSMPNHYEAVAAYNGNVLYAIGEGAILDEFGTADENADAWFKKHTFGLRFGRGQDAPDCDEPYPPAVTTTTFRFGM